MAAAKGAVLRLLLESYTKRDAVALISMSEDEAQVSALNPQP
jgi:Mg-chelatase subunit ChlD